MPYPKQTPDLLAGFFRAGWTEETLGLFLAENGWSWDDLRELLQRNRWTRQKLARYLERLEVRACPCWRARLQAIDANSLDPVRIGEPPCEHVKAMGHAVPPALWRLLLWLCWPRLYREPPLPAQRRVSLSRRRRAAILASRRKAGLALYHPGDVITDDRHGYSKGQSKPVKDVDANRPWVFPRGQTHHNPRRQPKVRVLHHELPD